MTGTFPTLNGSCFQRKIFDGSTVIPSVRGMKMKPMTKVLLDNLLTDFASNQNKYQEMKNICKVKLPGWDKLP